VSNAPNGLNRRNGGTGRLSHLLPIITWLPAYQPAWIWPDLIAGLTLAAYAVPVAMAYSSLAGLTPQAGLYGYIFGGIAYALFATSRHLAIGPTAAISVMPDRLPQNRHPAFQRTLYPLRSLPGKLPGRSHQCLTPPTD